MAGTVVEFPDIPLELEEEEVWRCLGVRNKTVPALAEEVTRSIALGQSLCEPRGVYSRLAVREVGPASVSLVGAPSLEGKFLSHCFEGAEEVVFLVVTIGSALEAKVSDMFAEGKSIEAFVLDAVGSAAAMNVFSHVLTRIYQEMEDRRWQMGFCLRPGQSYWDIRGQEIVFKVVSSDRTGVKLLDSCSMVPQKSQSAVVPLGPGLKVHGGINESYCRYCKAVRCPMRTEPVL